MADENFKRKDLLNSLRNLKPDDWFKVAEYFDLNITQPSGGSSHYAIRLKDYDKTDVRGLITGVNKGMSRNAHKKAFKRFLDKGFSENDIWKALKIIK